MYWFIYSTMYTQASNYSYRYRGCQGDMQLGSAMLHTKQSQEETQPKQCTLKRVNLSILWNSASDSIYVNILSWTTSTSTTYLQVCGMHTLNYISLVTMQRVNRFVVYIFHYVLMEWKRKSRYKWYISMVNITLTYAHGRALIQSADSPTLITMSGLSTACMV